MINNQKGYFCIGSGTSMVQIFAFWVLYSDNVDQLDELMNGFDMESIDPKDIKLTENPDNVIMSGLSLLLTKEPTTLKN